MMVEMVIVGVEVDIAKATLMMALRGGDGKVQRVDVGLCPEGPGADRIVGSLGERHVSQLCGRAVRAKVKDGKVVDLGNPVGDMWIVGEKDPEPVNDALKLEMDPRTEP